MEAAGLFFPLSSSKFVYKLSEPKRKEDRQNVSCKVFETKTFERNGGTMKQVESGIVMQTSDTLGSEDLLLIQWYMDHAGIYKLKNWTLGELYSYKKIKRKFGQFLLEPVASNEDDIQTPELCEISHSRLLSVVNDIFLLLDENAKQSTRLPSATTAA